MLPLNSEVQADVLKAWLQAEEMGQKPEAALLASTLGRQEREVAAAVAALAEAGLIDGGGNLNEAGRRQAIALTRSHRLLEAYLQSRDGVALEKVHHEADRLEHTTSPLEIERIADELSNPRFDPHGDPIPTREGVMPSIVRVPLAHWPRGVEGRIAHIEDEPGEACREIVRLGVCRGARIRVLGPEKIWHHGRVFELPAPLWDSIGVEGLAPGEREAGGCTTLAEIPAHEVAEIVELDPACTGPARHRLLDLGLVPGTRIVPDFSAAFNGPRTYRIRGTCIALRREQAAGILARPLELTV